MANRRQKTSRPATWSLCSCVMTMPSKLAGLIPEDSRRCAICRALNPASIRIRHCLVATREQLPPLPLPRTVKLNTPPIKAYKESEANQEMEGWKRNGRNGRMEGWKDGRMEGWKDGRVEGWKVGSAWGRAHPTFQSPILPIFHSSLERAFACVSDSSTLGSAVPRSKSKST